MSSSSGMVWNGTDFVKRTNRLRIPKLNSIDTLKLFQNRRNVVQCKSDTLKKIRCKKRTAKTKKCWIHLGKEDNLRIKKSTIPNAGEGLFTYKKSFDKNKKINRYTGKRISLQKINKMVPNKDRLLPYVMCKNGKKYAKCINAAKTTCGASRYVNDGVKSNKPINSYFNQKLYLTANKKIPPNTEILASYGSDYWNKKNVKRNKKK